MFNIYFSVVSKSHRTNKRLLRLCCILFNRDISFKLLYVLVIFCYEIFKHFNLILSGHYITAAVATAGAIGGVYCAYHIYKEYQKPKLPTEWKEVGTLKDIYVYPIKSCGPIMLNKAECTILGLKDGWLRDR